MRADKNHSAESKKNSAAPAQAPTVVLEDSGIGDIKIHENVISALARRATLGIEGVSRLAGSLLVDNIAEIVGSRRMQERAITVSMDESNRVSLEIKVNITVGYRIPDVAAAVQKAVISEIEAATGMTVTNVNVLVQEIESPQEHDDEAAPGSGDIGAMPIEPSRG